MDLLLVIFDIIKTYLKYVLNMSQFMWVKLESLISLKILIEDNFLVLPSWQPIIKKFTSPIWWRPDIWEKIAEGCQ